MKQTSPKPFLSLVDRASGRLPVLLAGAALLWLGLLGARRLGFAAADWLEAFMEVALPLLALLCAASLIWANRQSKARPEPFVDLLLDYIHEGLVATDLDLRIVFWGQGAEQLYGYSAAEVLGRRVDELLRLRGGEKIHTAALEALQHSPWTRTYLTWRKDGSTFWVDTHVSMARDAQGRPVGYVGVHRDVTDRRQTELALEESEKRLRLLMESVHLAAAAIDQEGRVTFCNDYLAQLSGWSKEEILGSLWVERFTPPDDQAERTEVHNKWMAGEECAHHQERPLLTSTGRQLIIAWNIITLRNHDGQPSGLAAIGEDITERLRAQQDEDRRMAELNTLRQAGRFITSPMGRAGGLESIVTAARLLLGSQIAIILLHDPKTRDLELAALDGDRDLLRRLFGLTDQPLLGQRIPDSYGVAGWVLHQQEPVLVANLQQIKGRENLDSPPHSLISVPMIFQGRAIGVMELDHATIGAFNEHHQAILAMMADFATMAIIHDRLLNAEREQRRLAEQSQAQLVQSEKLNVMGRLVAFLAHEINNPLQSLSSGLNLMREVPLSESEQREYLAVACREVERLSEIVERVLSFTRRRGDCPAPVDLHNLLEEMLALIHKRLAHGQVQVERCFAPDLPTVDGFSGQLQQVFLNLTLNALEAMPEGGKLSVSTLYDEPKQQVQLCFRDSGVGMTREVISHLFEPFYTTRAEGNGLGLPICLSIIEKHQGRIEIESEPGRGSCFTVILPVHILPVALEALPVTRSTPSPERKFDGRSQRKYPGC